MTIRQSLPSSIIVTALLLGLAQAADVDVVSGASTGRHMDSFAYDEIDSEHAFSRLSDELGLTGQQRTDLQIIIADYMPRYRDLAKLGRDTAAELLRLAPDSPEYIDQTQKASATAASSAAELVTLLSEMRAKIYAVLSIEQRHKIQELIEKRHQGSTDESPAP